MKDKILIYSVAGIVIFFLGFIAHVQYFQTKDNLVNLYSQKQQIIAKQAAFSVQKLVMQRVEAVETIREIWHKNSWDYSELTQELAIVHHLIHGFQYLFVIDSLGNPITGYPEGFPCPAEQPDSIKIRFFKILKSALHEKRTKIFEKNVLINGEIFACVISPIERVKGHPERAIAGVINLKSAITSALEPILIDNKDLTWVINSGGYLIFHLYHEQMKGKNVFSTPAECYQCHSDFTAEKLMFKGQNGVLVRKNIGGKKYLVGYSHVSVLNVNWLVGISTPFEAITGAPRKEFKNFLWLIVLIILTVVSGAVIFNRINSRNIIAKKELESLRTQNRLIKEKTAAESRYRILVEQSPDPIFLCTRKKVLMINPVFEEIFGVSAEDVYKKTFSMASLLAPNFREKFERDVEAFIRAKKPYSLISTVLKSASGKKIEAEISLGWFRLGNSIVYQGIIHDVTRTRQLERDQEQRKNLAMIGEMAARIAHEIKNPLASIQTGIQLLETQVPTESKEKTYYERLRKEIQRVDTILKGLLSYARQDVLSKKQIQLDSLIERFSQIIQPTMQRHKLKFKVKIENDLPKLWLDEQKMEQVLWNLTLNAVQASKENQEILCRVSENNHGVKLEIIDHGDGISKENLKKIFSPFFSTRTHGNGLGLAISKKIIEQHGGKLKIVSEEGKGTTVAIYLPENSNEEKK